MKTNLEGILDPKIKLILRRLTSAQLISVPTYDEAGIVYDEQYLTYDGTNLRQYDGPQLSVDSFRDISPRLSNII